MLQGVTPIQALTPVATPGIQHNNDNNLLNLGDNSNDTFKKVLYILNEFITMFNSLGVLIHGTHLSPNSIPSIPNYSLYRNDGNQTCRPHGVTAMFIKNNY
ncbi:hypothetical protein CEXT_28151 [Caerostris extrusa]|uniref:Uncharacterized protein n=1 Tax=Caerostris extrusa TaxID=172846 RepID=A0AAV4XN43_CAEEX|nr:hypothetical protein CEXT_28151 [Caerostris extrusa]